jgi:PilZ domain
MANETECSLGTAGARRWRRSQLTVPVRVTIENSRALNVINTRGSHMNDGGLAVRADRELTIGDEAEVKFTPPHFYPFVRLRGVIRNRVDDVYGLEFQAANWSEEKQLGIFRRNLARWSV